jgi:branched-subunit amino acid transport protein AzlD
MWVTVLVASLGCLALKLLGFLVPQEVLDRPYVRRVAALIPVAMLSGLIVVQAFGNGQALTIDARAVGLAAAAVALVLRAPFLVVVLVAMAAAAAVRSLGFVA